MSGSYAGRQRPASAHQGADAVWRTRIHPVFPAGRRVYGSPRIHAVRRHAGIRCGRKRVARRMRGDGLRAGRRRQQKPPTTDRRHAQAVAPHWLARDFPAAAATQKWVADITAIPTRAGWLYLAAILDVYSRRVIGWAMDQDRDEPLVLTALDMALAPRRLAAALLHHSDRGSQYTAAAYRARLARRGIPVSMSRKGDCYDNALTMP